ncbi:MAG TPA: hypothetical protein VHJ54_03340 [Solirubrobacterales bacterium]|jgi:hypothetical protein|nr:hypothetical protein [Solirubrobacterales bacterium]
MNPMLSVLILDAHRASFERTRHAPLASPFGGLPRLRDRKRVRRRIYY